jgi:hypothetical protein
VLADWAPGKPKVLVVDSYDAARGDARAGLWQRIIHHVFALADWHVVASVRTWDLEHSASLRAQFPNPPAPLGDLSDAELNATGAMWPELAGRATSPNVVGIRTTYPQAGFAAVRAQSARSPRKEGNGGKMRKGVGRRNTRSSGISGTLDLVATVSRPIGGVESDARPFASATDPATCFGSGKRRMT